MINLMPKSLNMDRRLFMTSAAAVGACGPRGHYGDNPITINTHDQIISSPNGDMCALNIYSDGGNELSVINNALTSCLTFIFPDKFQAVIPGEFSADGSRIALSITNQTTLQRSVVGELDINSATFRLTEQIHDYCICPHYSNSGGIAYLGRSAGGSFLTLIDPQGRTSYSEPFQSASLARKFRDGSIVWGVRGADPFEASKLDIQHGYRRTHILSPNNIGLSAYNKYISDHPLSSVRSVLSDDLILIAHQDPSVVAFLESSGRAILHEIPNGKGWACGSNKQLYCLKWNGLEAGESDGHYIEVPGRSESLKNVVDNSRKVRVSV